MAQRDLSISYNNLGDVQLQLGDTQAALKAYNDALQIRRTLAEANKDNSQAQSDLSNSYKNLGHVQLQLGDTQAALKAYNDGFVIRRILAEADRDNAVAQRGLSIFYNNLGDVQLQLGDTQAALKAYNDGHEILRTLADANKDNAVAQRDLSISYDNLGDVQLQMGDTQAALKAYNDALQIRRTQAEADKDNAQAQRGLMVSHYKLGEVYKTVREYKMSAGAYEAGAEVLRTMIANGMNVKASKRALAVLEGEATAAKMAKVALGEWDDLLEQPPEVLPALLDSRAIEFASRKDFPTATQAAGKLRELDNADNGNLYNAACVFALAAASVQPAESDELSKQQSEQRQTWINKAMATLNQAVEAGWTDFAHMRKDTDLTILRELPEFKTLGESDDEEAPN